MRKTMRRRYPLLRDPGAGARALISRLIVCALAIQLANCEPPRRLVLVYPDAAAQARAHRVELLIGEGVDCEHLHQASATRQFVFDAHGQPPTLGEVSRGLVAFRAAVRDAACLQFLDGCHTVALTESADESVRIVLQQVAATGCPSATSCSDGQCVAGDAATAIDGGLSDRLVRDGARDGAAPDQTAPDQTAPDQAASDQTAPDQAALDRSPADAAADAAAEDASSEPPWWNRAWSSRQYLRFHNADSDSDLTNLPVLVTLDASVLEQARPDGADLRFVAAEGGTLLAHEIESWGPSRPLQAWVRVPWLEAGSNRSAIWVYYGNSGAADVQDPPAVWSADYLAVLHFGPDQGVSDSTGHGHSAVLHGTLEVDGLAGFARSLNGTTDYIEIPSLHGSGYPQSQGTVELFARGAIRGQTTGDMIFDRTGGARPHLYLGAYIGENVTCGAQDDANAELWSPRPIHWLSADDDAAWQSFAMTHDLSASQLSAYHQGGQMASTTLAGFAPTGQRATFGEGLAALVDEIRVSSVARSRDWFNATRRSAAGQYLLPGPPSEPPLPAPRSLPRAPGAIALYDFDEISGAIVHDSSALSPALDLVVADPDRVRWLAGALQVVRATHIESGIGANKIADACAASNAFTVEAWVMPDSPLFSGPSRIVTFSQDAGIRNFTLGQATEGYGARTGHYGLRYRTSLTDPNGTSCTDASCTPVNAGNPTTPAATVRTDRPTHVVFTRSADVVDGYLDGAPVTTQSWPGVTSNFWDGNMHLALANEMVSPDGQRTWLGTLYLVAIYCRALSADEVAQNYQAGY